MAKHLNRAHTRKGKGKGKKSRSARRSIKQKKQSGGDRCFSSQDCRSDGCECGPDEICAPREMKNGVWSYKCKVAGDM